MTSLVLLLSPALASTLSVDPSDSSAYATIQDAIDSAASGDVVEVVSGTFTECIDTSGLDLTIIGDGATSTIIDGAGTCTYTVTVDSGVTVSIEDLGVTNLGYRGIYVDNSVLSLSGVEVEGAAGAPDVVGPRSRACG